MQFIASSSEASAINQKKDTGVIDDPYFSALILYRETGITLDNMQTFY